MDLLGNGNGGYVKLEGPHDGVITLAVAGLFSRKYRRWQFKMMFLLALILLLISWLCYSGIIGRTSNYFSNRPLASVAAEQRTRGGIRGIKLIDECKLPRIDPWDPVIEPYLDPSYYMNWLRNCKRTYPELTRLVNGYVVMHPEAKSNGTVCEFRCLYPHTDFKLVESSWKRLDEEPDCDFIETRCRHEKIQNNAFYYNYLHAQIYRRLKPERKRSRQETTTSRPNVVDIERPPDFGPDNGQGKRRPPDVHLFILDSVSHTQFLRTMPKTVTWLRERMGAVSFPHLNKVGHNSRPNAYGIFFGIQATPVEASPMGEEYKPPRNVDKMGSIYLDNEPFVGFEYRERNYRTMMAEDWAGGAFNWPSVYGFGRAPVEHYMRPFQLRAGTGPTSDKGNILAKIVHDKSCKEPHHHIVKYLMDFIDVYEEQPKFSISWMISIAHDTVNGPYRIDAEVYHFLRDYEARLDNSFLFVMGDHGLRFGGIRETKQGEVEDNNPALFLVLPKHLRYNNRLTDNLRENARQLVTQFDVHATLVNIARQAPNMTVHSPFDQLAPELRGPTPLGQSLLYPFNKTVPRNCGTLKIPFEICLCQFQTRDLTKTEPKLGLQLAKAMVLRMNAEMTGEKADDKCAPLAVDPKQPVELVEFEPELGVDLFKVTYKTLPGNGRFWGFMKVLDRGQSSQNFIFISNRFPRLNKYAEQSFCTDNYAIAPYCYCKALLKKNTSPTNQFGMNLPFFKR